MSKIKYTHLFTSDKKLKFCGLGEWVEEPDTAEFTHRGIKCLIRRVFFQEPLAEKETYFGGHLCGYITLSEDHPWTSKGFNVDAEVHGGVTYNEKENGMHLIGFDCGHSVDFVPTCSKLKNIYFSLNTSLPLLNRCTEGVKEDILNSPIFNPTYKNMNFCIEECKRLAEQSLEASHDH